MFIELIDLLRCTRPHEDSWLVATFHAMRERRVIEGLLSCPVCGAQYVVSNGIAYFDVEPSGEARPDASSDEEGMRVAAYLNLVEPGVVVLAGAWASAGATVAKLGSRVIALNSAVVGDGNASHLRARGVLPLARECVDGIALDASTSSLTESGARALKIGARMVAPAAMELPEGLVELARDSLNWVAVREGGRESAPVQIGRR